MHLRRLEKDTTNVVVKSGGQVLGSVKHPSIPSDFSSLLLQAQRLEGKGHCLPTLAVTPSMRSSRRPIRHQQERPEAVAVAGLHTDIDSVGLRRRKGLVACREAFYWDLTTRRGRSRSVS